ncbi:MAG: outer membrane beta-barrel protein [Bernardetiaceae bacterium]
MQTPYFWHRFDLCRYQITATFLFLLLSSGYAQRTSRNMPDHDQQAMHYGFQIGGQMTNFKIRHSSFFVNNEDSIISIHPKPTPSFSLGFILNFNIYEEEWSLRLTPNVSFFEQQVVFNYRDGTSFTENVEAAFFEVPILVKHKSLRRGNTGLYLIGGFVPSLKVGGQKRKEDPSRLGTTDYNLEITYGFGFDLYQSFFKFAPEIRFSHGFPNMLFKNGSSFGRNLERISTHRVSIFLNFEG